MQNTKSTKEKGRRVPISYSFSQNEIVGYLELLPGWEEKITPHHKIILNGRFDNMNKFRVLNASVVREVPPRQVRS